MINDRSITVDAAGVERVDSGTNQHGRYAGVPYLLRDNSPTIRGAVGEWGLLSPEPTEAAIQNMIDEGAPAPAAAAQELPR